MTNRLSDDSTSLGRQRLLSATERISSALLQARQADGIWRGDLSSSALSTATAVTALAIALREARRPQSATGPTGVDLLARAPGIEARIEAGLRWLAENANSDGGWGDTTRSLSNLSTTTLCWAAFGAADDRAETHRRTVLSAERWIRQRAGGIEPEKLAPAVIQRYGKDRTFSVPILTMCALAGRLGTGSNAWRWIIPLPFELAACPHRWFAALRLPVVSYALPALIAIGQARHHHSPSGHLLVRWLRSAVRARTLHLLERIQPRNGGFLEATPLTSFVAMSLAASGQLNHPATTKGIEFLEKSMRPDGSWPIDTDLATWVTTLSVSALAESSGSVRSVSANESANSNAEVTAAPLTETIRDWLLQQQYTVEHPYTHAAPGGWAWTDLPGGVPDADDTAGALVALRILDPEISDSTRHAAEAGLDWLLNLQNRDGGIPTFCRGWGALPFDRSSADITAHALRAWGIWKDEMPSNVRLRTESAIIRALRFLKTQQRPIGSWSPLWFGNERAPEEENPVYGTSRVVAALSALTVPKDKQTPEILPMLDLAVRWILGVQNGDGGWGGDIRVHSSMEETALAVEALAKARRHCSVEPLSDQIRGALERGVNWVVEAVEREEWRSPQPIGFYFAKLWYWERLYPLIFTTAALRAACESRFEAS